MSGETLLWEETVQPGATWSHVLKRGTSLRIEDTEGGANVGMLFYNPVPGPIGSCLHFRSSPYCALSLTSALFPVDSGESKRAARKPIGGQRVANRFSTAKEVSTSAWWRRRYRSG